MREKLTKEDIAKIEDEIEERKVELRPKLLEDLKEAAAQGDRSENFEYYAAKRAKNRNESRIRYLENVLRNAIVIEDTVDIDEVGINKTVTVLIEEDDEEEIYSIVTSIRGDVLNDIISIESPLGKAIMGHKVGDRVLVKVSEEYSYHVIIKKIVPLEDADSLRIRQY